MLTQRLMRRRYVWKNGRNFGWTTGSRPFTMQNSSRVGSLLMSKNAPSIKPFPHFLSSNQVRSKSGISSVLSSFNFWAKDVVRTWRINPPNPILQINNDDYDHDDDDGSTPQPDFQNMLPFDVLSPYHLEKATQKAIQQYKIDIAEWELSLTNPPSERMQGASVRVLYKIEAPIIRLHQVGKLFTELASPPDQVKHWQVAYSNLQADAHGLPWRHSKIIYRALREEEEQSLPAQCRLDFQLNGAHVDDETEREELQAIQEELQQLLNRFAENDEDYNFAPKAVRLQMVSDLYNWIGLSNLQAQKLGYSNIFDMYAQGYDHRIAQPNEVRSICKEVSSFLKGYLPEVEVTLNQDAGAFLSTKEKSLSDEEKDLLKARYLVRKTLRLHGVLQAIADFCEAIFGIRVEQNSAGKGWNPNVRVLQLSDVDTGSQLGSIYMDPFQDPYWRSENAENLVTSHLFAGRRSHSTNPIAVMALKIPPVWDDAPVPLSWDDTLQLLFHFGNALQVILSQVDNDNGIAVPAEGATLLASFMEMWILNDGFLQRLAQLSQDGAVFGQETIDILRDDLKKQKSIDLMDSVFLGSLELELFTGFDPRGEETLSELQTRYAEEYVPHDIPDSGDLSPLFDVLQGNALENGKIRAYDRLLSSVLAGMVYEKFKNTDLRDQEKVKRLGRSIRGLFHKGHQGAIEDVAELCGKSVSAGDLRSIFGF